MSTKSARSSLPSQTVINAVWILLCAAVCLQILLKLVHVSMFFDGGIVASVARNLSEGRGTIWAPHFSETLFPTFVGHPPLIFWLLAIGFSLFGDTIVVEKAFSLITFVLSAVLLFKIWMRVNIDDIVVQKAFPLALVMTLIAGRVNWGFANGIIDNLLAVFSLTAVLLVVVAYDRPSPMFSTKRLAPVILTGVAICFSLMTKGPIGLFPLAAPIISWLVFRRPTFLVMVLDTLIILAVILLFFATLYAFEASRDAMDRFIIAQRASSLTGADSQFDKSVHVLRSILAVNGYSLTILALSVLARWRFGLGRSIGLYRDPRVKRAAFLILIGISASLPIMLSPRIANFYFNTSLFFYSAGFAILISPTIMEALSRLRDEWTKIFSMAALAILVASVVIVIANMGRPGTDAQTIEQAMVIERTVCAGQSTCKASISACENAWQDWALHTYMQRFYKISIAKQADVDADYIVAETSCGDLPGYRQMQTNIKPYTLMKRQS
ncbi:4-amino-4-deoxy-L-arabinose transferase [Rhizobium sp. RU33A]|uniref:ArnT family glycosyltransferase n=1 Tax=Rhizobium sp. RU33A TaxID=1907413 RepID=UPI000956C1DC|nr:glycosyltransferase family 39 protein [Rhizobium sp. RU33A]SIQ89738.1 4-amino-4-deoxy-L-arabinose transferase [Rhizobium sp. RU33A]